MIKVENRLGTVSISNDYFTALISRKASACFGVTGMVPSGTSQGIRYMAGAKMPDKGVIVSVEDGALVIELHIEVIYGVNINEVVRSLVEEVQFAVEQFAGLKVKKVNVCVDSMKFE